MRVRDPTSTVDGAPPAENLNHGLSLALQRLPCFGSKRIAGNRISRIQIKRIQPEECCQTQATEPTRSGCKKVAPGPTRHGIRMQERRAVGVEGARRNDGVGSVRSGTYFGF